MRCVSKVRCLYFRIFSTAFLMTFLSPEISTSFNLHVLFSLSRIMMSYLLLGVVLSICIFLFHNVVTLTSWLVYSNFGTWSYQCSLFKFTPISLHMLKCSWAHTVSCLFMSSSFASIGHVGIICSIFSSNYYYYLYYYTIMMCGYVPLKTAYVSFWFLIQLICPELPQNQTQQNALQFLNNKPYFLYNLWFYS
jgi:hypothetical protein